MTLKILCSMNDCCYCLSDELVIETTMTSFMAKTKAHTHTYIHSTREAVKKTTSDGHGRKVVDSLYVSPDISQNALQCSTPPTITRTIIRF